MAKQSNQQAQKGTTGRPDATAPVRPPVDPDVIPATQPDDPQLRVRQEELIPSAIALRQSFTGPLPPPKLLSEYEQALPGLAERIVKMAEVEGNHRRAIESRLVRLSEWGLGSALFIALALAAGGFVLLWNGKTLEGLTPLVLAVVGLVTVFVVRKDSGPPADTTEVEEEE